MKQRGIKNTMDKTVPVAFAILVYLKLASAGGTLSINLIHFENEKSLKPDGSCCDVDGYGKCTTCQYYFIICISETGSQNCSIERIWTNTLAYGEYNVFGDHFYEVPSGEKVQNPIILPISKWSGSLSLKIDVYDEDKGNDKESHLKNDLVCAMQQNLSVKATPRPNEKAAQNALLLGELRRSGGFPKLTLTVRVHCDKNYLIPTCTDYCIDTDDSTGHYRCNYDTGKRECYSGWYGDRCSVECNARNDTFGHYKCDQSTGMKICLAGWRDVSSNCTKSNATNISSCTSTTTTTTTITTSRLSILEMTRTPVTNPKPSLLTSSRTINVVATPSSTTLKLETLISRTSSRNALTKTSALKSSHPKISLVSAAIHGSQAGVISTISLKSEICVKLITSNIASKHQNTQGIEALLTAHILKKNNTSTSLDTATGNTRRAEFPSTFNDRNIHSSRTQNASSSFRLVGNEARQGSTGKQQKLRENFSSFSPFIISAGIFAVMALLVLFLLFKKKRSTKVRHLSDSHQSHEFKRNYSASMRSTRDKSFMESHPNTPIPSRTEVSARTLATPSTPVTQATPSSSIAPRTPLSNELQATTTLPVNLRTPVLSRKLPTPSAPVKYQTSALPRTYQGIQYLTTELCETSVRSWTPDPGTVDSTRSNEMKLLQQGNHFETCPEVLLQRTNSSRAPIQDLSIVLPRTPFKSWTPIPPKTPTEVSSERQNWTHS